MADQKSPKAATIGKGEEPKLKKQAVVVIHGMGEQMPMGTLRSFVESVWETDPKLLETEEDKKTDTVETASRHSATAHLSHVDPTIKDTFSGNPYWIKPDDRAGLQELRRITTGPLKGTKNEKNWPLKNGGRRTDFYEFYWADLMQGTTWQHLSSWVSGLLLRSPRQVPWDVFPVWLVLWAVTAFVAFYAVSGVREGFQFSPSESFAKWLAVLAVILVFAFVYSKRTLIAEMATSGRAWLTAAFVASAALLTFNQLGPLPKWSVVFAALPVVLGYLLNAALKNYFGDVARYVRATPANVERRNAVRERGLALLRGLHESGDYDRIVVVSHSLGTIIAYDLINILWSQLGPSTKNQEAAKAASSALLKMDEWLSDVADGKEVFAQGPFREMQREISAQLSGVAFVKREDGSTKSTPWLISDLVTLGSPLTHAEFLLARNEASLNRLIEERTLPVCPPVLEAIDDEASNGRKRQSFLYTPSGRSQGFPHHASCFCAVRWTNIYDKPPSPLLFLLGDVISGPLVSIFGAGVRTVFPPNHNRDGYLKLLPTKKIGELYSSGIREEAVNIRYGVGRVPYLFTHTEYWHWQAEYDPSEPPNHIEQLRRAIHLAEPPQTQHTS